MNAVTTRLDQHGAPRFGQRRGRVPLFESASQRQEPIAKSHPDDRRRGQRGPRHFIEALDSPLEDADGAMWKLHLAHGMEVEAPGAPARQEQPVVEHHPDDLERRQWRPIAQLGDRSNDVFVEFRIAEVRSHELRGFVGVEAGEVQFLRVQVLKKAIYIRERAGNPAGCEDAEETVGDSIDGATQNTAAAAVEPLKIVDKYHGGNHLSEQLGHELGKTLHEDVLLVSRLWNWRRIGEDLGQGGRENLEQRRQISGQRPQARPDLSATLGQKVAIRLRVTIHDFANGRERTRIPGVTGCQEDTASSRRSLIDDRPDQARLAASREAAHDYHTGLAASQDVVPPTSQTAELALASE